jgi:hypothetical protein
LETEHLCEQLEALAEEHGLVSWLAANHVFQGWLASTQGEHERAITLIRGGLADWKQPSALANYCLILVEACLRAGRYQGAMDAVAAGREHAVRTGHRAESEVERVAGETLLLMGAENATEAEQCFRDLARSVGCAEPAHLRPWSKKSLEVYQHLARCWTISRRD